MTADLNFNNMDAQTLSVVATAFATVASVLVGALTALVTWWAARASRNDTCVQTRPVLLITLEDAPSLAVLTADNIEVQSPGGHKPTICFTNGGVGPMFDLKVEVEVKTSASGRRRPGLQRLGRIGDRDLQVLEFPRAVFVGKAVPGFGFSPLAKKLAVEDRQAFTLPTLGPQVTRTGHLSAAIVLRWVLDNLSERAKGGATLEIKASFRDLEGRKHCARRTIVIDVIGRKPGDGGVTWELSACDQHGLPLASIRSPEALRQATNDDRPGQVFSGQWSNRLPIRGSRRGKQA